MFAECLDVRNVDTTTLDKLVASPDPQGKTEEPVLQSPSQVQMLVLDAKEMPLPKSISFPREQDASLMDRVDSREDELKPENNENNSQREPPESNASVRRSFIQGKGAAL
mmetsp:Transcript_31440/g.72355  ORF Transcript_31440/g.72355 Transcript_31440/m.72355 type:complete len:110 (-) Transcript_31440:323-652(-)